MKEKYFSNKIRKALREEGYCVWPVETGSTATGVPDLLVIGRGIVTFIEVKSRPTSSMRSVSMEIARDKLLGPGQRFFGRQFACGSVKNNKVRHMFVAVSCKEGSMLYRILSTGELEFLTSFHGKEGTFGGREFATYINTYYTGVEK